MNFRQSLNDEEKDFVIKRCINHELFCFPKSFNIENIEENNLEEDVDGLGDGFAIAETLDCVRADIEEETQMEFQEFLQENGSSIAEQALYEYAETNAIVALDQNGNVIKEFYSFDEIATYFGVKRADNVKNVLVGRQKSAYGYVWKYRKDLNANG